MSQQYGRKPSRSKLLWWSFTEFNWGGYALAVFLIAMVCVLVASATGILPKGSGTRPSENDDPDCVRYSSYASSC
ncbi:hypothetical protein NKH82_04400 [Mesorhizobium sp. M0915]|uniref:hypothetical protein n=1 Tax=Mesorhizobium sp. M0915 TaxID=2957027 RepID=UPI00333614E7